MIIYNDNLQCFLKKINFLPIYEKISNHRQHCFNAIFLP